MIVSLLLFTLSGLYLASLAVADAHARQASAARYRAFVCDLAVERMKVRP